MQPFYLQTPAEKATRVYTVEFRWHDTPGTVWLLYGVPYHTLAEALRFFHLLENDPDMENARILIDGQFTGIIAR